jgi:hypothetical protein
MESFGCDQFFRLLSDGKASSPILKAFCGQMLDSYFKASDSEALVLLPAELIECARRMYDICGCIVALIVPTSGYKGTTLQMVNDVLNYKGVEAVESTLKLTLTNDKFWQVNLDSMLRTATWATKTNSGDCPVGDADEGVSGENLEVNGRAESRCRDGGSPRERYKEAADISCSTASGCC